ncbi:MULTISPECIES: hypothetical protein [Nostoc]|uniref:Uncharacterized protein n=1 Tax=Nostoc paludosum FACHB-159 TaxID=2692908 RepID=A0ABR8K6N0_9NOSO|nr:MULTISPECIES: hypothetical protein [Nostoc]MBD2677837.1 hypothetical protein [Nostoc sp. FACHB-857]MBD2733988.1 hypothetical protein [Nostoc paludosum FACHB-159]
MKESDQKALEIFENTYKEHKYLWEKWQSHQNLNEEDKKKIVDYLYNEAILYFFIPNIDVKPQLKEVERIQLIDYLDELKDKDLDWGLFFRDRSNLNYKFDLTLIQAVLSNVRSVISLIFT